MSCPPHRLLLSTPPTIRRIAPIRLRYILRRCSVAADRTAASFTTASACAAARRRLRPRSLIGRTAKILTASGSELSSSRPERDLSQPLQKAYRIRDALAYSVAPSAGLCKQPNALSAKDSAQSILDLGRPEDFFPMRKHEPSVSRCLYAHLRRLQPNLLSFFQRPCSHYSSVHFFGLALVKRESGPRGTCGPFRMGEIVLRLSLDQRRRALRRAPLWTGVAVNMLLPETRAETLTVQGA